MPESTRSLKVWRYMSFGRFVWMLKRKALWMSRVDQLDDAWEGVLGAGDGPVERRMFVNCWTAQNSESHAMWSIYCRSQEGVAIQTTLSKLRRSVERYPVLPVKYVSGSIGSSEITPLELAVRKRRPFQYEKERRIVHIPPPRGVRRTPRGAPISPPVEDANDQGGGLIVTELYGFPLAWEPEKWLEAVLIHPGADDTFRYALEAVVEALAPDLKGRIRFSRMAARPPKLSMRG